MRPCTVKVTDLFEQKVSHDTRMSIIEPNGESADPAIAPVAHLPATAGTGTATVEELVDEPQEAGGIGT